MRQAVLLVLIVLPGVTGAAVFGWFALKDWSALQAAYRHFEAIAQAPTSQAALFVVDAKQNIHRVNLFADGVWALLSAIYAAIGVHGLCLLPSAPRRKNGGRS